MEELITNKAAKIYRGAFTYHKNDSVYCEETFEVFKHTKELTLEFKSESLSRVVTGELLKINVNFIVSKNWIPKNVMVEKSLGHDYACETYDYHERTNTIAYTFKTKTSEQKEKLQTPPRFHIATPTMATSFLFLLSKKFDNTTRNDYSLLTSHNNWQYAHAPKAKNIYMIKPTTGMVDTMIDGKPLKANHYKLFDAEHDKEDNPPVMDVYISKHSSIPYMVNTNDGVKIQVKYLNDMSGAAE